MTRLGASAMVLLLPALSIAAPTHCTSAEEVVFSCPLQRTAKVVSVCASPRLLASPSKGHLIYRFGKLGAVELEFPQRQGGVARQVFALALLSRPDGPHAAAVHLGRFHL